MQLSSLNAFAMDLFPRRAEFDARLRRRVRAQVVWTEFPADLDTPVSVMLKLGQEQRFSALLESVEGGATRGRYSFIAMAPDLVWRCKGQRCGNLAARSRATVHCRCRSNDDRRADARVLALL